MGTRSHIYLFTTYFKSEDVGKNPECILYHHWDGYPSSMLPKVTRFLDATREFLHRAKYPYWWDGSRVGAIMIMLSAEDQMLPMLPFSTQRKDRHETGDKWEVDVRPAGGVPSFQPMIESQSDIEWYYDVILREDNKIKGESKLAQKRRYYYTVAVRPAVYTKDLNSENTGLTIATYDSRTGKRGLKEALKLCKAYRERDE